MLSFSRRTVLDEAGSFSVKYYTGYGASAGGDPRQAYVTLPVAPISARVDLVQPTFSNPTVINNSLFSISQVDQALLAEPYSVFRRFLVQVIAHHSATHAMPDDKHALHLSHQQRLVLNEQKFFLNPLNLYQGWEE